MCDSGRSPANVTEALGMLDRALACLASADVASLPSAVQAEALRALGRAEARHAAARARVLTAFAAQGGYEDDGHGTARTWLRWQTRITTGAAAGAIGWVRRLAAHPVIGQALAAGELSPSWARQICEWIGLLPEDQRGDADEILAGAARGGANLAELGGLAREMYERCGHDDGSGLDDGFADRWFRLGITFRGAGRAEGDLTPGCAAALSAVLEALGKKAGPEDIRTSAQRRHDALEEACRRLIRSGVLPGRAGQPTQVLVHMTLAQLRGNPGAVAGVPGASAAEDAWAAARASQPGWVTGPETIPAHLRRAVTTRHSHCAFPGCDQPASVCDVHHIVPRACGGPTAISNLVPLCSFHHVTAIHRWGWELRLNTDGTTAATSPDRTRTLYSHSPPPRQAA
jgi:Domain of unknown function (DUF222)/HNH endonuclease